MHAIHHSYSMLLNKEAIISNTCHYSHVVLVSAEQSLMCSIPDFDSRQKQSAWTMAASFMTLCSTANQSISSQCNGTLMKLTIAVTSNAALLILQVNHCGPLLCSKLSPQPLRIYRSATVNSKVGCSSFIIYNDTRAALAAMLAMFLGTEVKALVRKWRLS